MVKVRARMPVSSIGEGKGYKSLDITFTCKQNWPLPLQPNPDQRAISMVRGGSAAMWDELANKEQHVIPALPFIIDCPSFIVLL